MKNNPKSRKENIVVQDFAAEVLIYDLKINKAFCLNETSKLVWQLCDGNHSVSEINHNLNQKLKTEIPEDLVWIALDQLKRDNLLEKSENFEINFNGLDRRQIIKKIGLASMVILPVVSSVVAPGAVAAASGFPFLAACTVDSECASGNCSNSNPTFPQICCVTGVGIGRPPGTQHACTNAQGVCDSIATSSCCSGTSTLRTDLPSCSGPTNFPCVCDPMP